MRKILNLACLSLICNFAFAETIYFTAKLSGANVVPAVSSDAQAVFIATYETTTKKLELYGTAAFFASDWTSIDIRNAAAGQNGPSVYFTILSYGRWGLFFFGPTLSNAKETELLAGRFYVEIRTQNFPNGELRAQLTPCHDYLIYLKGNLSKTQVVPPSSTPYGDGEVRALLNKTTHEFNIVGMCGIDGVDAFYDHGIPKIELHEGAAGVNGPVLSTLVGMISPQAAAVIVSSFEANDDLVNKIMNGPAYIDVHTPRYGSGETRAQLSVIQVLPVKLISFNGYRNADKVELTWSVENQRDFKDFTIEQLNDRSNQWMQKGSVAANGLSGVQQYSFSDLPTPGSDILLYRLRMTDVDGKKTYSSIVKINFKNGKAQLGLLSNPVKDGLLRFQLTGISSAGNATAVVMDMSGRILKRTGSLQVGANAIDISTLPAGVYKLAVIIGNEKIETSFIK